MLEKKRANNRGLAEAPPHYYGHRERLRERFREVGADALSDYELLEACCFAPSAARRQAARESADRDIRLVRGSDLRQRGILSY